MLHELSQKHEECVCDMFSDEKSSQGIFDHFMPLVASNIFAMAFLAMAKWLVA